ncbi:uncharacterized protein LOC143029581 [Oratosquilla oratoria]|uniref:uncharacterized protein LOC143029581 n=1 Tax=Oratosquilla oratoria TaxID=337810 RepID=UPI003F770948
MASVSTQTDSDIDSYNGISIFLCLIKENHAETQCTVRSMVDVCVNTEELSLDTQVHKDKDIQEAKDEEFRKAKEILGYHKKKKRGRPPKARKKDDGDISKENKGNPNLTWIGRRQRKRKIPSKFESSDFECSLFSNKPDDIEESMIKEEDEAEEEQFVITVNEDEEWEPTEGRISSGRVLYHMNGMSSDRERFAKVSGEGVIDKAVMTISIHPSDDGHGLTQVETMGNKKKENVTLDVDRTVVKRKRKTHSKGPFICEPCDLEFEKHNHLVKHKLSHEIAEGKHSVKCEVCGKVLSSQVNLRRHMLIHTGKPFICDKCGKGFTGMYMLSEHKHEEHGEVVPLKKQKTDHMCISCGKYLASKDALKYHRSIPQQCSLCPELYPCKRSLKEHQICVHDKAFQTVDGRIVCTFCEKTFTYRHKYLDHVASHTGEKRYECFKCKKKFVSKMSLNYHCKQVHEKHTHRYSCSNCDKVFISNAKLIEHMRTHTGEKPYMCESCGSSFAVKATLKNHMQAIHAQVPKARKRKKPNEDTSAEYKYDCPMCHLRDLTSSDLENHCQEEHDAMVQFALQEEDEDVIVSESEIRDVVVGSTHTKDIAMSEIATSGESISEEGDLCKSSNINFGLSQTSDSVEETSQIYDIVVHCS